MRLLIDENVPLSVAQFFEQRGHEVIYVRDILPAGTPDPVLRDDRRPRATAYPRLW